jgi:hypothetical protein
MPDIVCFASFTHNLTGGRVSHAAFSFSMYTPPLILLPFAAPLIKRLAHHFPDEGLSRVKAGRQVIIDIVKELLAERRKELAVEQVRHTHACCPASLQAVHYDPCLCGLCRVITPGSIRTALVAGRDVI